VDPDGLDAQELALLRREAAAAVGQVVAEELRNAGLTVEWDGSPDRAVAVVGLDWKRRR
jgi:hypothetical protein